MLAKTREKVSLGKLREQCKSRGTLYGPSPKRLGSSRVSYKRLEMSQCKARTCVRLQHRSLPYSSRRRRGTPAYITGPITPSLCITLVILAVFNFSQLYGILETHKPTVNASLFRTSCEFMSFTSVKGILRFTHRPPTLFVALEEERDIPNRDGLLYNSGDAFSDLELQQIGTERGVGVGGWNSKRCKTSSVGS
ncbi:uncharacterized protein CEXT_338641 [Caerostris extrusa]|uniref:Uncharacterized protein n=1 Tax=Caerostris extrusa TaxID=172846 RepID=A0AAV4S4D2_CAEEX|nr:uncharacterized protein CEXT_338641 [Caerostris extrusa]